MDLGNTRITIKDKVKKYINYLVVIGALVLTISLIKNIENSKESLKRIEKKEQEVKALESKNEELKKSLEKVQSQEFIEKQIRDQLGLARDGEIVLVLPEDDVLRRLVPKFPVEEEELPDPVWKKWYKLFF